MRKKRDERRREQRASPVNRSLSLPSNPSDISPEHLHDFLSLSSSPPLPSSLPRTPMPPSASSFDEGTRDQTVSSTPSFAQVSELDRDNLVLISSHPGTCFRGEEKCGGA